MKVMSGQLQGSASGSRLWNVVGMDEHSLDAAQRVVEGFFDVQRLSKRFDWHSLQHTLADCRVMPRGSLNDEVPTFYLFISCPTAVAVHCSGLD